MIPKRLAKIVRQATGRSVQKVERLWADGAIGLGRATPFGLSEIVYPGETVTVLGEPIGRAVQRVAYAMHKPAGVTTSSRDPDGRSDLSPWLAKLPRGVFAVGRLDRDTSGLLLLTSDGDLSYALLLPQSHVEKEYVCTVRWHIEKDDARIALLRAGVTRDGETMRAADVELEGSSGRALTVVLTEGKHRQVRRMCKAVGLALSALTRVRVGPVRLEGLGAGETRALAGREVEALWASVGGRDAVRARQIEALGELARRRREEATPDARLEQWLERRDRG